MQTSWTFKTTVANVVRHDGDLLVVLTGTCFLTGARLTGHLIAIASIWLKAKTQKKGNKGLPVPGKYQFHPQLF
ncbi:hypothetical protein BCR33DRAFT_795279 [Rhizoclosmatium globosum]|uniref:Uncharacterized protein n=1 Tax=Rhizoclosmatium globosum TaxID=329046 RepID=A0A1Y2ASF7_9FUNG|nr:hypothetical protein BCR33DRAFT_795279 [Rhizoclosmatium globosum]|eukprot:ORY25481.1 hypothetical protein BCR33DRAFT_795279 [Rhizoclosmatium globosum]